jgi:predicted RNA-binding Zn-ribbon protein involved in translation (DUF1610 family)
VSKEDEFKPKQSKLVKVQAKPRRDPWGKLLGIELPLYVEKVDINFKKHKVLAFVSYYPDSTFTCPVCGAEDLLIHSHRMRNIQTLDVLNFKGFVRLKHPKVLCPKCGVKPIELPFVRIRSTLSKSLERYIVEMCQIYPVRVVSKMTEVPYGQILNLMQLARIVPKDYTP